MRGYELSIAIATLCNKEPQNLGGTLGKTCILALGRLGASAEMSGPGQGTVLCLVSHGSTRWLCTSWLGSLTCLESGWDNRLAWAVLFPPAASPGMFLSKVEKQETDPKMHDSETSACNWHISNSATIGQTSHRAKSMVKGDGNRLLLVAGGAVQSPRKGHGYKDGW